MNQGESVATQQDVKMTLATAAQVPSGAMPSSGGQWQAGTVSCKFHQKIKVDGQPVIYEAQCIFTYSGGKTADGIADFPTPFLDTVVLKPKIGKLKEKNIDVLLNGDAYTSPYGNTLEIKSHRKLKLN
ncbi:hypothetical protein IM40_09605 (plasmid) [Candidatus Paracaedimonas acanthamoebae]|nr:hypothetical protein IM40_09605 [Candidatus Paracaedimonas acanthamoebae]